MGPYRKSRLSPARGRPMVDQADEQAIRAYVDEIASRLDLSIDPASRPLVAAHLARLWTAAAVLMEFPLPEDVEPAQVFRP